MRGKQNSTPSFTFSFDATSIQFQLLPALWLTNQHFCLALTINAADIPVIGFADPFVLYTGQLCFFFVVRSFSYAPILISYLCNILISNLWTYTIHLFFPRFRHFSQFSSLSFLLFLDVFVLFMRDLSLSDFGDMLPSFFTIGIHYSALLFPTHILFYILLFIAHYYINHYVTLYSNHICNDTVTSLTLIQLCISH